jgi:hypothetical protein
MRRLVAALVFVTSLMVSTGGLALADDPHSVTGTTGQPGAVNGITCQTVPGAETPGNSASNNGSPFSATGQAGNVYAGNPGTASAAHANSPHAVSEYDVACFQAAQH